MFYGNKLETILEFYGFHGDNYRLAFAVEHLVDKKNKI